MELSQYSKNLDPITKTRYFYKIEDVGKDPYLFSYKSQDFPKNVTFSKIYEYLIAGISAFTGNHHQNSNSIKKADELFRGGWLKELGGTRTSNLYVVLGKVLHSQRLNERPVEAWVIIDNDGKVDSAHCQCKAGLYETCTHIGVVLFGLQSISSGCSFDSLSVTDVACYWRKAPVKCSLQSDLRSIDFKKKPPPIPLPICVPNIDRKKALEILQTIKTNYLPAAATSFNEFIVDNSDEKTFFLVQFFFANLFKVEYRTFNKEDLCKMGKKLNFSISSSSVERIEKLTKLQSQSPDNIWQKLRIGRVTASVFKEVCKTNKSIPAMSLLRKICEPKSFSTAATAYGKRTEKQAVKYVEAFLRKKHQHPKMTACGLFILKEKSFYAATPDSIFECLCCGRAPVEVKCPFNLSNGEDIDSILNKDACIVRKNTEYVMNVNHQYYFQVQLQIHVLNVRFGYFSLYSPKTQIVIKVDRDENFININMLESDKYFYKILLPELMGFAFTRSLDD